MGPQISAAARSLTGQQCNIPLKSQSISVACKVHREQALQQAQQSVTRPWTVRQALTPPHVPKTMTGHHASLTAPQP